MALDMDVDLGPGHIVLDGTQLPLKGPQFSAHVNYGQTAVSGYHLLQR